MTDHAVARRGDPGTSWAAARSLDPATLRASQLYVLRIIQTYGPMTDTRLCMHALELSQSGARSRRAELVTKGLVFDTGKRETLASGRRSIVWGARHLELTLWGSGL